MLCKIVYRVLELLSLPTPDVHVFYLISSVFCRNGSGNSGLPLCRVGCQLRWWGGGLENQVWRKCFKLVVAILHTPFGACFCFGQSLKEEYNGKGFMLWVRTSLNHTP